jgi:PAS domain S-box-containing protein
LARLRLRNGVQELAVRAAQQKTFIEEMPASIAVFDNRMRYLAASRSFLSNMASLFATDVFAPSAVIGRSFYETYPKMPLHWRRIHARALAGDELAQDEDALPRHDDHTDWVRWSMKPWRTANGRIGGALLFSESITEKVEARQALAESEARFRATFENAAVGIAHLDSNLRWIRANTALCRILGWPINELVTKSLSDITHPDDLARDLGHIQQMLEGVIDSYSIDKRYVRKDGRIIWGRLSVSAVRRGDITIDYFVNVIEDITVRKHAEEELLNSEERFKTTVLHSPQPILLYDDGGQVLAVSDSWLEQSGYTREELPRIEAWTAGALGEHSGHALERTRNVISKGSEADLAEMTVWTKGGQKRIWSFVDSAVGTQSGGRRLFVSIAQDVTERKAHEEQVLLLMREVNHRAMNMLSLVQVIADQTTARDPENFIRTFGERVQALAANQDLLVRSGWRGTDVQDLVHAQLAHFASLIDSRIAIHGPKLRLNPTAAQAIGLALHELATNAAKYGALSTEIGRVDISWGTDGNTYVMSWTEHGGPPVSAPQRFGFGTTVTRRMAQRSVGGRVDLDYPSSGIKWHLNCPAENALEAE